MSVMLSFPSLLSCKCTAGRLFKIGFTLLSTFLNGYIQENERKV